MKRMRKFLLVILLLTAIFTPSLARAVSISDYTAQPPFLPDVVPPNILFTVDLSRNMYTAAYGNYPISTMSSGNWTISSNATGSGGTIILNKTTTETFSGSTAYYGIFDSMRCYQYSSGAFQESTATSKSLISSLCPDSNPWDGNFLNWLTMRKMDIVKRVLVGGKPTSASGSNVIKLGVETPSSASAGCDTTGSSGECWRWVKKFPNGRTEGRAPGTFDFFGVGEDGKIYNTGSIGKLFTNNAEGIYEIQLNLSPQCVADYPCPSGGCDLRCNGVFQELGSDDNIKYRLALMIPQDSGNGGKVDKPFDSNFTPSTFTNIRNMIATSYAPLAESIYEATQYFKQTSPYYSNSPADYTVSFGAAGDPYYFNSSGRMVSCCKGFILLLSAGEFSKDNGKTYSSGTNTETKNLPSLTLPTCSSSSTNDCYTADANFPTLSANGGYSDDIAHWAHLSTTDLRTDLDGVQNIATYVVSALGGGHNILKSAAKYGGFDDINGNNLPDLAEEWSKDGGTTPKSYFEASQGDMLRDRILEAIAAILKSSASGTSVSVLATSAEGEGALYQAYFYPNKYETTTEKRVYLGYVRGLFLDKYGNLREDNSSSSDKALVLNEDRILQMTFDTSVFEVNVKLYSDSNEDGRADSSTEDATVTLDAVEPIWEAGRKLALRDKGMRNVYTWVDSDNDGIVDNGDFNVSPLPDGEAYPLVSSSASALQQYLRAGSSTESQNIINFIRGNAIPGYRNRCRSISGASAETNCTGTQRVWTLGDVIYSTPTVVAAPREQYDIIYGLPAIPYRDFKNLYKNRRNVVYVGANDGMLHAFNAGVYTAGDDSATPPPETERGWFIANPTSGSGWSSNPEIGDELWAFIPYDNLPHLAWLTCGGTSDNPSACNGSGANYVHTYYVDLKPKVSDVRVFCYDSSADSAYDSTKYPSSGSCVSGQSGTAHPGGWGTILIMGMRLGGGAMDVTADFDGGGPRPSETRTFRSAYYAFDITNPEKKPRLLWRFTHSTMGFTSSYPGIIRIDGSPEKWFMVVGSGPDNNAPTGTRGYNGSSNQQGRVFVVELVDYDNDGSLLEQTFTTDDRALMGEPTVVDVDLDFTSDVVYIGNVYSSTGSSNTWTLGKTYRINTNRDANPANWRISTLINQGQPLTAAPSVSRDSSGNLWVFFGTGRLWNSTSGGDKDNPDQQSFYGIKDGCWKENSTANPCATTYDKTTQLADASSSAVNLSNQAVSGVTTPSSYGGSNPTDYSSLLSMMRSASVRGWYVNLAYDGSKPSERVLSKSVIIGGVVLFTSFIPNMDMCAFQGDSSLYALYYETGTAYIKPVIGYDTTTQTIYKSTSLGKGMPTTVGVAIGDATKGFIQTSTGTIVEIKTEPALKVKSGPASWREKPGSSGTVGIEEIYKHIVK